MTSYEQRHTPQTKRIFRHFLLTQHKWWTVQACYWCCDKSSFSISMVRNHRRWLCLCESSLVTRLHVVCVVCSRQATVTKGQKQSLQPLSHERGYTPRTALRSASGVRNCHMPHGTCHMPHGFCVRHAAHKCATETGWGEPL